MVGAGEFPGAWESMACYETSPSLPPSADDGRCEHCRKFLTTECEHVDEFLEEEEEG